MRASYPILHETKQDFDNFKRNFSNSNTNSSTHDELTTESFSLERDSTASVSSTSVLNSKNNFSSTKVTYESASHFDFSSSLPSSLKPESKTIASYLSPQDAALRCYLLQLQLRRTKTKNLSLQNKKSILLTSCSILRILLSSNLLRHHL